MLLFPRNHRRLMPPVWAWVLVVFLALLSEVPAVLIMFWFGMDTLVLGRGTATISGFAGIMFAVWRVAGFHPILRAPYRHWLDSGPWRPGDPLPLGPVGLTATDLVVVGLLSISGIVFGFPAPAAIGFLVTWVVGNIVVFQLLGMIRSACGMLLLLGAGPVIAVVAGFAEATIGKSEILTAFLSMIPVVLAAIVAQLRLPHSLSILEGRNWIEAESDEADVHMKKAGWPVIDLTPQRPTGISFGRWEMVLISLTTGWLCYSAELFLRYNPDESGGPGEQGTMLLMMVPSIVMGLFRVCVYLAKTRPPISMLGRVVVGPLVQWKYDRVFVMPVLGVVVSFVLIFLGIDHAIPIELAFGLAVAIALVINLLGGPDLATFRLTGTLRLSPPAIQTVESVTLTSSQTKNGQG